MNVRARPLISSDRLNLELPLCLFKHDTMVAYEKVDVYFHSFIMSALD